MSKKEKQKALREIRHAMLITRPLRGYLGNQYYYWEREYQKLKSK